MNKTFKLIVGIFIIALAVVALSSFSSAYSYYNYNDNEYSRTFYEKTSYGETGNTYVRKEVTKNDGYERTSYVKVKDSDNNKPSYANDLNDYWYYGADDYTIRYYKDSSYDDSYRRSYSGSSYHDYYYNNYPHYNGNYYSWSYKPRTVYVYHYPRCISNRGCSW